MRASRRSAVYRVFSAAVIALLLIALLSGNALAAGTDGLTVEWLKAAFLKELTQINDPKRVSQIRLVGTEL